MLFFFLSKVRIKSTPTKAFLTREIEPISSEVSTESSSTLIPLNVFPLDQLS